MYVLVSPCILDPALRARNITTSEDLGWYARAAERCRKFGIEMVPLPCPETLYLGNDRDPGAFVGRLDTQAFADLLDDLEGAVREIIRARGPPLFLIGVNSSPCCGVTKHFYQTTESDNRRRRGRGMFLDRFRDLPAIDVAVFSRYRIYLAAPLFSAAEREYNTRLSDLLRSHFFEVYLPQDTGDDSGDRGLQAQKGIFDDHCRALDSADYIVAVVDGADADSGTSWEIGYSFSRGIPVVALRTDFRMAGLHEQVNLMLEQSATLVRTTDALLGTLMPLAPGTGPDKC